MDDETRARLLELVARWEREAASIEWMPWGAERVRSPESAAWRRAARQLRDTTETQEG